MFDKHWVTINGRHILLNDSVDWAESKREREIAYNKAQADLLNNSKVKFFGETRQSASGNPEYKGYTIEKNKDGKSYALYSPDNEFVGNVNAGEIDSAIKEHLENDKVSHKDMRGNDVIMKRSVLREIKAEYENDLKKAKIEPERKPIQDKINTLTALINGDKPDDLSLARLLATKYADFAEYLENKKKK